MMASGEIRLSSTMSRQMPVLAQSQYPALDQNYFLGVAGSSSAQSSIFQSVWNSVTGALAATWSDVSNNASIVLGAIGNFVYNVYANSDTPLAGIGGVAAATEGAASEGTTLFRVFGGDAQGLGQSWTTVNPGAVSDFRTAAGIFPGNSGQFVIEGTLTDSSGVLFRPALPGPGGIGGGLPEIVVPNPGSQICIVCVSGANPPF